MNDEIVLTSDDGEEFICRVIEETKVAGCNYVLVEDADEKSDECYILKDTSEEEDEEAVYEIVADGNEQQYIARIFNELMEDMEIE